MHYRLVCVDVFVEHKLCVIFLFHFRLAVNRSFTMTHVHMGRAHNLVTLSPIQNIDRIEQKPDSHLK